MSVAESVKLFRANVQRLWRKAPWLPLTTIWLSSPLEQRFAEDCRRAGFDLAEISPFVANTLRWVWKRSVLDRRDDAAWQRALAAARKRQAKIGPPPPEDYSDTPPADTPPTDPRIRVVLRRLNATELARTRPPVDRQTKCKARKAHSHRFRAPVSFDWQAFLAEHWSSTFGPLVAAHHLDPAAVEGELGRRLAVTWHAVLDEQAQLGEGACGAAHGRWMALLRQIKDDRDQDTGHYLRRP